MSKERLLGRHGGTRPRWPRLIVPLLVLGCLAVQATTLSARDESAVLADAIDTLRVRAYGDDPTAAVLNDLANLLVLDDQIEAAIAAYQRGLELEPTHLPSAYNLGLLQDSLGLSEESMETFLALLEAHPEHAPSHYQIGVLHERAGERREAIEAYARAFELDPFLALPDVNPQIADNSLVTLALLEVEVTESAEDETARIYAEPSRVTRLLLPSEPAPEPAEAQAPPAESETAPTESVTETEVPALRQLGPEDLRRARTDAPSSPRAAPRAASVPEPATEAPSAVARSAGDEPEGSPEPYEAPGSPEPEAAPTSAPRMISAEDLSPQRVNQATPPTSSRGRPVTGGRLSTGARQRPGAVPRTTPRSPATAPPAGQPRSSSPTRFRPGRRSTAQLDLRVVPPVGAPAAALTGGS